VNANLLSKQYFGISTQMNVTLMKAYFEQNQKTLSCIWALMILRCPIVIRST